MEKLTISVVMCVYNGENYIKEQLDSINAQSVLPNELIICDDGSRDNTMSIVEDFEKIAKFDVKVIQNAINMGVTKNFEQACKLALGDVTFFCDQDDRWREDKIAKHLAVYDNHADINLIFSNATLFGENASYSDTLWERFGFVGKKKRIFKRNQLQAILIGWFVTGATMSARTKFIKENIPFDTTFLHDEWLSFIASLQGSLYALDECLTMYRQHSKQVIGASAYTVKDKIGKKWDLRGQAEKLSAFAVRYPKNKLINGKVDMLLKRSELGERKLFARFCLATKILLKGQYSKYSQSALLSYAKDIIKK